jgi:hypothetical protein
MSPITPSHIAKIARAKEHLVDLEREIAKFADAHPYTAGKRVEGKKQKAVWRLEFTASPANTPIPIIAADVIYNLRSSLDHLMSAMVEKGDRGSAMFPIFFQGVWEAIVPGENQQRIKDRMRWASCVKTLPDEAVAVLKGLQPPDRATDNPQTAYLSFVNRLSNRDRHEKLPVVSAGLRKMRTRIERRNGVVVDVEGPPPPGAFQDQTVLGVPQDTVNVEIAGVPVIAVKGRRKLGYIEIPLHLVEATGYIEEEVFPPLARFVRADAA